MGICNHMQLDQQSIVIDDSLEVTVKYIVAAINFVYGVAFTANKKAQLPFAMDFCIAFGEPKKIENKVDACGFGDIADISDDEDDDDDDSDDKIGYVDII